MRLEEKAAEENSAPQRTRTNQQVRHERKHVQHSKDGRVLPYLHVRQRCARVGLEHKHMIHARAMKHKHICTPQPHAQNQERVAAVDWKRRVKLPLRRYLSVERQYKYESDEKKHRDSKRRAQREQDQRTQRLALHSQLFHRLMVIAAAQVQRVDVLAPINQFAQRRRRKEWRANNAW